MQIPVIVKIRFWYSSSASEKKGQPFFKTLYLNTHSQPQTHTKTLSALNPNNFLNDSVIQFLYF